MAVTTIDIDNDLLEAVKRATGATTMREATLRAYETTIRVCSKPADLVARVAALGVTPAQMDGSTVPQAPDPSFVVPFDGPGR